MKFIFAVLSDDGQEACQSLGKQSLLFEVCKGPCFRQKARESVCFRGRIAGRIPKMKMSTIQMPGLHHLEALTVLGRLLEIEAALERQDTATSRA